MDATDRHDSEAPQKSAPELLRALAEMPERRVYFSLEALEWSIYIFSENERQLLEYLDQCENGSTSEDLWNQASEWHLTQVAREISRLLHNHVAAAVSLVAHADTIHRRLFRKRGFPEYLQEKKRRIYDDPLVQFVKELRNHLLHQGTTSISFNASAVQLGGPVTREISLSKADLERSHRWLGPAKTYLDNAPRTIPVRGLVEDYGHHVELFYEWYWQRALTIWEPEYLRYRAAMEEYLLLRIESHVDAWLENPTAPCREIGFLRRVIDDTELSELLHLIDGSQARTDRAVAILREHLSIPESLADKLRRAFAMPGFRL